jgi:hypothetical protein
MSSLWQEVAKLVFSGERFGEAALDLSALVELTRFKTLVDEAAKELWRQANPERARLPGNFEQHTRLFIRQPIGAGSTAVVLEAQHAEEQLLDVGVPRVDSAVALVREVLEAVGEDKALPALATRVLLPFLASWGETLKQDEQIELRVPGHPAARTNPRICERLRSFAVTPYTDSVDKVGRVLAVDVRQSRFQLWPDEKHCVEVAFTEQQEADVTEALREHRTRDIRVQGTGEFSGDGTLKRVRETRAIHILPPERTLFDDSARPIWEEILELASDVPLEEWSRVPRDLSSNHDQYVYGSRPA